jgi:hypothetical protein
MVEVFHNEVGVLIVEQQPDVKNQAEDQVDFGPTKKNGPIDCAIGYLHQGCKNVIGGYACQEYRDVHSLTPAIEQQAGQQQHDIAKFSPGKQIKG